MTGHGSHYTQLSQNDNHKNSEDDVSYGVTFTLQDTTKC